MLNSTDPAPPRPCDATARGFGSRGVGIALVAGFVLLRLLVLQQAASTPLLPSNDEAAEVFRALRYGSGDLASRISVWGALPSYLLFGLYGAFYLVGRAVGRFSGTADFLHLYATDPDLFVFLGRCLYTAAGIGLLHAVRRAARASGGMASVMVAVATVGLMPACIVFSRSVKADGMAVFLLVLAALAAHRLSKSAGRPAGGTRLREALLVGALAGAALACKYHVILLCPVVLVPAWRSRRALGPRGWTALVGATVAVFVLSNPAIFVRPTEFFTGGYGVLGRFGNQDPRKLAAYSRTLLPGYLASQVGNGAMAVVLMISVLAGCVSPSGFIRLVSRSSVLFLALVAAMPYAERHHFLPALPFMALALGDTVERLLCSSTSRVPGQWARALVLLPLLQAPAAWQDLRDASTPSTITAAETWAREHLPADAKVLTDWAYVPRLARNARNLERERSSGPVSPERSRLLDALLSRPITPSWDVAPLVHRLRRGQAAEEQSHYDLERYRSEGVGYVIISDQWYSRFYREPLLEEDRFVRRFYDTLRKTREPTVTFSPEPGRLTGPRIDVFNLKD